MIKKTTKSLVILIVIGTFLIAGNSVTAATIDELLSQVAALQAQIKAFQSRNVASIGTIFTQNLTIGSTGSEVSALQQMLAAGGHLVMPAGVAFGYFGSLTQKAVARWQASNGVAPAVGYWGPLSRVRQATLGGATSTAVSTRSGGGGGSSSSGGGNPSPSSQPIIPTPPPTPTPTPALPPPPPPSPTPTPTPNPSPQSSQYPLHTNITAAVFWVGEPVGNGSSEDNALSAWDDTWQASYGGYDDYQNRNGYYPTGFTPKENPFYLDLPYNDFNDNGNPKSNRLTVVPWANEKIWDSEESMMKNRWVKITRNSITCYGQIEDAGPYQYDDYNYVFSTTDARPKSTISNNAGMDVSPALRDCLHFVGQNNVDNKVDWQFINFINVPDGPWKMIVTTSQINWP